MARKRYRMRLERPGQPEEVATIWRVSNRTARSAFRARCRLDRTIMSGTLTFRVPGLGTYDRGREEVIDKYPFERLPVTPKPPPRRRRRGRRTEGST